jgi:hypothetical protein
MSAMTHQIDRLGAGRRVDDSEAFAAGLPARRSPAGGLTPAAHHRFGPGSAPIPTRISWRQEDCPLWFWLTRFDGGDISPPDGLGHQ